MTKLKELHLAALRRAYRTLAQGLGGSVVTTALVALVTAVGTDADAGRTALLAAGVAVGTTVVTAAASFWQGVASGLPEVEGTVRPTPSGPDPDDGYLTDYDAL